MLGILAAALSLGQCPSYGDPASWFNVTLDASISYVLHHKVEGTGEDAVLHVRLEAYHSGWLGFGLSESTSGHMKGSDLLTAYVSNGKAYAEDRYAAFAANVYTPSTGVQSFPTLTAAMDDHQDWTVVSGNEINGWTTVYMTRAVSTSDEQDRTFTPGQPTRIVWAFGASDSVAQHSGNARGSMQVTLGAKEQAVQFPAHDGFWERRVASYNVPEQVTTYACESFEFPTDSERHIVAFEPLIASGMEGRVHHFVLHTCDHSGDRYWATHDGSMAACGGGGGQGDSPLANEDSGCDSLIWSWAVGQGPLIFPSDVGIRTGTGMATKISKVILEIHYDNPTTVNTLVDTSGFRAYYVNTPRANDAGMMRLGDITASASNAALSDPYETGPLPAATADIHRQFTCPSSCTSEVDGDEPINIIGIFHHMHYLGRKMYLEHYSGDKLQASVATDRVDFWDNGYQQLSMYDTPLVVNKGDELQTHCYFDTTQRTDQNEFGSATEDEMCMQFVLYYPIRTKGVDADGDAVLFGDCGARVNVDDNGQATLLTMCGGPTQDGGQFVDGQGQVDRGTTRYNIAGSTFGAAPTLSELPAASNGNTGVETCTFTPPSPPPPTSVYSRVEFSVVAAGDVNDYTGAVVNGIKDSIAATLDGVVSDDVEVEVTSASVLIAISIAVTSAAAETSVSSQVTTELATTTSAGALLTNSMPSGIGAPTISVTEIRALPGDDDTSLTPVIAGAVAGGLVFLICLGCFLSFFFCNAALMGLLAIFKPSKGVPKNKSGTHV